MDLQAHASVLAGALVPLLTQLMKLHVFKVSNKSAQAMSIAIAGACVVGAHLALRQPISPLALLTDTSMAWTLSQVVYRQAFGTPVGQLLVPGTPAAVEPTPTS